MNFSALAGQISSFARRAEEKYCTHKIKKRGIPAGNEVPFGSPLIVISEI